MAEPIKEDWITRGPWDGNQSRVRVYEADPVDLERKGLADRLEGLAGNLSVADSPEAIEAVRDALLDAAHKLRTGKVEALAEEGQR